LDDVALLVELPPVRPQKKGLSVEADLLTWVAWRVILDYLKFDERKESDDSDLP
jgi:hypothetical protein